MDLVFVNQTFGMGGAENFNLALARYLSQKHHLKIYTNNSEFAKQMPDLKPVLVPFTADIIGNWKGLLKSVVFLPILSLYYALVVIPANLSARYYFTGFIEKIIFTPLLRLLGQKTIWIEFGPVQPVTSKFWRFPDLLYRLAARFADTCIFSSQNSLDHNRQYFPPQTKLVVIQLGSPPPPVTHSALSDKFDVLCISRLEPGKGQDLLIKSWSDVVKRVPSAKLCIAGQGDQVYVAYLKSLIAKHKLTRHIFMPGRVADKYGYFRQAKFTVFPSVWALEGFGLVITESLSMGKPVVAFDHPPGNEILISGYNGLLSDTLTENIVSLLTRPKLLRKLSQNARLSWEKAYREEIYLKKYADTILR